MRQEIPLLILQQCAKDVQHLHMPLRKLKIGTYVSTPANSPGQIPEDAEEKARENPYYPIATATMDTRVFDIVHMFSERGISAVPIIDESGVVVNLYETVDVIVSHLLVFLMSGGNNNRMVDACTIGGIPIP